MSLPCRRCSECAGHHHWLPECCDEDGNAVPPHYICKHCEATARMCENCCDGVALVDGCDLCEECIAGTDGGDASVYQLELLS